MVQQKVGTIVYCYYEGGVEGGWIDSPNMKI